MPALLSLWGQKWGEEVTWLLGFPLSHQCPPAGPGRWSVTFLDWIGWWRKMFVSIVGPGTGVSDECFLTDRVCVQTGKGRGSSRHQRHRERYANQSCLCPWESGIRRMGMTKNTNSKSLSNYQFEKCHKERVESLTSHTHLDTRKHICGSCGVACGPWLAKDLGSGEV